MAVNRRGHRVAKLTVAGIAAAAIAAVVAAGAVWLTSPRTSSIATVTPTEPVVAQFDKAEAVGEVRRLEREQGVQVSRAQLDALSDGELTDSEYRRAVQSEMSCIQAPFEESIVQVSRLIRDGGNYTFSIGVEYESNPETFPDEEAKWAYSERVSAASDRCAVQESAVIKQMVGDRRSGPPAN